ncbi:MAG: hypothetical protein ISR96_02635 [Nitrospira sp.]|nr:hypothetical protein [Nitrospira sp.]
MRHSALQTTLILLILAWSITGFAQHHKKPVTPYGDFGSDCSHYGNCKKHMTHEEAKKAMIEYYHHKGMHVELENNKGRFIRAKVKKNDKVVDRIIFDRRTGRVKSIY